MTTLTIRMAEFIGLLIDMGLKVKYLHSEIET